MYNKAVLIGRMTGNPELKTTPGGVSVCSFRIAVDRAYTKDKERKTDFFAIVTWRNTAEFVSKYFSKGRMIGVEGPIETREYTDKEGNKRTVFEIVADKCFFVGDKKFDSAADDTAEDLPF